MNASPILRVAAKILIPFIVLFGLYVQFHGDFGPGGGFQAGCIVGTGFILYALVLGVEAARGVFPDWLWRLTLAGGVLIFSATGFAGILRKGNYLDYFVLVQSNNPATGQHVGILLVEAGVGMTVTAAMVLIFFAFAGSVREGS